MAQRRRGSYPPEFRAEAVRLARTTTSPLKTVAHDLGVSVWTLRAWMKQPAHSGGTTLKESERLELLRLRRENRELRLEREILKKATAFFAKQSE
jgi:transposase-like protein